MADLIDAYAQHLQTLTHPQSTIETYVDLLRRLDRQLPYGLYECCHDELVDAIYVPGRKPATRALYRAAVREFFRWAADEEDGVLDFDPTTRLPRVRVPKGIPRPVSTEQLAHILANAAEPYRTWFLLAAGAGLRCISIASLDREHVTSESIWVHGKGGKKRTVPCHPQVWAAVSILPPGPVARSTDGSRATRKDVRDRGNRHLQVRLGMRDVHMHRLRHYFASQCLDACGNLRIVQELLGHASPNTTAIYTEVSSRQTAAAVAALPLPAGT